MQLQGHSGCPSPLWVLLPPLALSSAVTLSSVSPGGFPVPRCPCCAGTALAGVIHLPLFSSCPTLVFPHFPKPGHVPCETEPGITSSAQSLGFFCTAPLAVNMDLAPGFSSFSSSVCSCPVQLCGSPGMLAEGMSAWQGCWHTFPLAACLCLGSWEVPRTEPTARSC